MYIILDPLLLSYINYYEFNATTLTHSQNSETEDLVRFSFVQLIVMLLLLFAEVRSTHLSVGMSNDHITEVLDFRSCCWNGQGNNHLTIIFSPYSFMPFKFKWLSLIKGDITDVEGRVKTVPSPSVDSTHSNPTLTCVPVIVTGGPGQRVSETVNEVEESPSQDNAVQSGIQLDHYDGVTSP